MGEVFHRTPEYVRPVPGTRRQGKSKDAAVLATLIVFIDSENYWRYVFTVIENSWRARWIRESRGAQNTLGRRPHKRTSTLRGQAIDRPLTAAERAVVAKLSSHIEVSSTGAWVEYEWGDFKHDPIQVLARYFDAFQYFAN